MSLRTTVESDDASLTVYGRADVVWMTHGLPTAVEEIKTTRRDPSNIQEDDYPLHWAQAACYAHMLCERYGLSSIAVRLTYARVNDKSIASITRTMSAHTLREQFLSLANAALAELSAAEAWRRTRNAALQTMPFPYKEYRPGQRNMAAAAYRACKNGGRLLCEAPTGVGKTAAMLFSSLKAMGEGHVERVFYLTARGTTRLAAEEGLNLLRRNGLRARSIVLTAKDKICPCPGCACMPDSCPRAKGHYDRASAARLYALADRDDYAADYLTDLCDRYNLCPFEFGLDLSLDCDVIIADYNYAFDPVAHLRRYFDQRSESVLLIDEAHNLPDRARAMYSASVNRRSMEKLRREVGRASRKDTLYKQITQVIHTLRAMEEEGVRSEGFPAPLVEAVEAFVNAARDRLGEEDVPYAGALLDAFFEAFDFSFAAARMREWEDNYATLIDPPIVELRCLMPAPFLAATLDKVRAAVFFSATMTPAQHYASAFGTGDSTDVLRLSSPFPRDNLLVLNAPLPTTYRQREGSAERVARCVAELCVGKERGNYFVFFPSYAYLRAVMPLVGELVPQAKIIQQRGGMDERERAEYLAEFSEEPKGILLAFAVLGGLFGEGIDLPGGRLSGCAIVGIGLPQIGLERETLRAKYDERGEDGFANAYVYPGIARVTQAAGRVIRTREDRGVVLLIDERFGREDIEELLPQHWDVQRVTRISVLRQTIREFWL
jgi:Rad3-related DNA helicase